MYLPPTGTEACPTIAGDASVEGRTAWISDRSVRWERVAHEGTVQSPRHPKNSYASETPVTDGERVYVLFGNLGIFTYDLQGQLLWSQRDRAAARSVGLGSGRLADAGRQTS